jgi:DNA-binding MarR family transcriptional regulator
MTDDDHLAAMTDLVLATFRLNGALLQAGDELVRDLGLTSARWQVIGAVALAGRPLTVPQIARRMGLTRQAVQRIVNDLAAEGLVTLEENPDHKRARLVLLSAAGTAAFAEASERQAGWAERLGEGLDAEALAAATELLRVLDARLREGEPGD